MPKGTLLVVESNPGVLIVARNVLGRRGHTVLCAGDPTDGLTKARADLPDLMIVDAAYATPEVLCALSATSPIRVPILLSTPTGLGGATKACLPALDGVEIAGVIEKPFTPDVLAELVNETLLDYNHTRPLRIDSARFKAPMPKVERRDPSGAFAFPTLLDPHAVRISPVADDPAETVQVSEDELPVVPWVETPPLIPVTPAPDSATGTETIQETLDAESACDLIDMAVLGIEPPPVPVPSTPPPRFESPPLAAPVALFGGLGVSARAKRLATRLRRATSSPGFDSDSLEAVCEEALRDEQLFGGLGTSLADGDPLVAGRVGPVGVPQVLQLAEGFSRPVCCRFERDVEALEVVIQGRYLRFARQENLPEIFRLGRFLVEIGVLAGRNLSQAVEDARLEGRRLGRFLLEEGVLRPEDLDKALTRQFRELVFELLAWEDGRFSVTACDPMPAEVADANIELPLTGLVLDGLRRRDEWGPTMDSATPTPV